MNRSRLIKKSEGEKGERRRQTEELFGPPSVGIWENSKEVDFCGPTPFTMSKFLDCIYIERDTSERPGPEDGTGVSFPLNIFRVVPFGKYV